MQRVGPPQGDALVTWTLSAVVCLTVVITYARLEPAELYHEVLEHRWFLSEAAGSEISMEEAARSYMRTVLQDLPDEAIAVSAMESMGPLANPFDPSLGFADEEYERPYDPWEDEAAEPEKEPAEAYLDIAALRARGKK